MRLKNLHLNDFGIYNNQKLEALSPNIVVIGGPNRSGKTTFMHILRYLGYGIPNTDKLPAPADKYDIEADIETEDNLEYQLKLKGYADPVLISLNNQGPESGPETPGQLYNNLDRFTYHQIFTISLDELTKEPAGLSGKGDKDRLQSILLGAGLSKIVELPQAISHFDNKAYNIGRTTGRASVGEFKPYQENIAEAEKKKDEALKQVKKYIKTEEEIDNLKDTIDDLNNDLNSLEKKRIRIDLLKNNYHEFSKILNLRQQLENHTGAELNQAKYSENKKLTARNLLDDFISKNEKYQQEKSIFKSRVSSQNPETIKNSLLNKSSDLENYQKNISGLKEKIDNFIQQKERNQNELKNIKAEAVEFNQEWEEDFNSILSIRTDQIERRKLLNNIADFKACRDNLETSLDEKHDLESRLTRLNEELSSIKDGNPERIFKNSLLIGFISIGAGAFSAFFNIIAAIVIGGGGLLLSYLYYHGKHQKEIVLQDKKENLDKELEDIQHKLSLLEDEIEDIKAKKNSAEKELNHYQEILGLENSASPELIKDYFNGLRDINNSYDRWLNTREEIQNKKEKIVRELDELRNLLVQLNSKLTDSALILPAEDRLILRSEELFSALDKALEYLNYARNLNDAWQGRETAKSDISDKFSDFSSDRDPVEFLQGFIKKSNKFLEYREKQNQLDQLTNQLVAKISSADHIKDSFIDSPLANETDTLIELFQRHYNSFTSIEEVETVYKNLKEELDLIAKNKKMKEDRLQSLKDTKKELASPAKIEEAHATIDNNQSKLKKLAERYAINRTASFIFKEVQARVIKRAREELLQPAADLLSEMTAGEYQEINPPADLKENDFKTRLASGREQETVNILSRGTKEQLFLAVRLSRIKEIKPALPVILDDSLVNFDRSHLINTVQILSRLGNSHQIFVLTCHPHLVRHINDYTDNAQYWHLESGKFKNVAGKDLYNLLLN